MYLHDAILPANIQKIGNPGNSRNNEFKSVPKSDVVWLTGDE